MSIDLGNAPVGTPPTPTEKTQLRTSFGLGATDTVEFGGFVPPAGTTAEIDAVTTATVGQVMINSDTNQQVRFTGAAIYEKIASRSYSQDDSLVASSNITLDASRFLQSGLVTDSPDFFNPTALMSIYDSPLFSNTTGVNYFHHDGSMLPVGWYNQGTNTIETGSVVVSGKQYRLSLGSDTTLFGFNQIIASDITDKGLLSTGLQGGSAYVVEVTVPLGDLAEGNVRFDVGYTGLYSSATAEISCDDLIGRNRKGLFKFPLEENDLYLFSSGSKVAISSPKLGIYSFKFVLRPSSDGTFTLTVRQALSNLDPLLLDKAQSTVTLLTA